MDKDQQGQIIDRLEEAERALRRLGDAYLAAGMLNVAENCWKEADGYGDEIRSMLAGEEA